MSTKKRSSSRTAAPDEHKVADEHGTAPVTELLSVSAYKSKGGLRHVLNATRYSLLGVRAAWRHEAAFRQELWIGIVLLALVPWGAPSLMYGALMVASILLVWCVEMINSAIEALADAISVDANPLLGRAKDLGSAAVMFCLLLAVVVWGVGIYLRVWG